MKIKIKSKDKEIIAELYDNKTAKAIASILPLKARARRWGDEIYFPVPIEIEAENPKAIVKKGELGFWLEGKCFCIFFGKTPISESDEAIRPASEVNVFGKIVSGMELLRSVEEGDEIHIEIVQ